MISKKKLLSGSSLCVIIDRLLFSDDEMIALAQLAVSGGADMIQLRDKKTSIDRVIKVGKRIKDITKARGVPLIVNDRLDAALAIGADGVHIGQGDLGIDTARRLIGGSKIIGVTVKTPLQARAAKKNGADYIGAGPVFKTPIKNNQKPVSLDIIKRIEEKTNMPVYLIGGIDASNIKLLTSRGFNKIAVIRAVSESSNPLLETRRLKRELSR